MKKIILRGPLTTNSGYGVHARQIARWVFENVQDKRNDVDVYTDLLPWGITSWITDVEAEGGLVGRLYQNSKSLQEGETFDLSLQVQLPNEWNPFLADFNVGITAAVETNICNPEWIDCVNRMDLIIVPSEFTRNVFINTAKIANKEIKKTIVVIPESFPDQLVDSLGKEQTDSKLSKFLNETVKSNFNFLLFGQLTGTNPDNDRKNLPYTLKWLCETFMNNEDVGIIIKTNRGRNTKLDRDQTTIALTQLLSQILPPGMKGPKVYLLHGNLSEKDLLSLYTHSKVKAIVSATKGEGFGIPLLEAAACDLPVLATNWSGHKDFLDKGKYIKFDYQLQPIHPTRVDNQIFINGSQWAQPDEMDVKRKLKKFYESSSMPRQWAKELGTKLREEFCFKSIASKYDEVLKDNV
jgi:glycosyltransferase involved in cell wall biosynthesis